MSVFPDCGTGCDECESDADDVVTCVECDYGYYLKDGACSGKFVGSADMMLISFENITCTCGQ